MPEDSKKEETKEIKEELKTEKQVKEIVQEEQDIEVQIQERVKKEIAELHKVINEAQVIEKEIKDEAKNKIDEERKNKEFEVFLSLKSTVWYRYLIIFFLFLTLFLPGYFQNVINKYAIIFLILLVYGVNYLFILLNKKKISFPFIQYFILFFDILLILFIIHLTGKQRSIFVLFYNILICISLILGVSETIFVIFFSTISYAFYMRGNLYVESNLVYTFLIIVSFFLTAGIAFLFKLLISQIKLKEKIKKVLYNKFVCLEETKEEVKEVKEEKEIKIEDEKKVEELKIDKVEKQN